MNDLRDIAQVAAGRQPVGDPMAALARTVLSLKEAIVALETEVAEVKANMAAPALAAKEGD